MAQAKEECGCVENLTWLLADGYNGEQAVWPGTKDWRNLTGKHGKSMSRVILEPEACSAAAGCCWFSYGTGEVRLFHRVSLFSDLQHAEAEDYAMAIRQAEDMRWQDFSELRSFSVSCTAENPAQASNFAIALTSYSSRDKGLFGVIEREGEHIEFLLQNGLVKKWKEQCDKDGTGGQLMMCAGYAALGHICATVADVLNGDLKIREVMPRLYRLRDIFYYTMLKGGKIFLRNWGSSWTFRLMNFAAGGGGFNPMNMGQLLLSQIHENLRTTNLLVQMVMVVELCDRASRGSVSLPRGFAAQITSTCGSSVVYCRGCGFMINYQAEMAVQSEPFRGLLVYQRKSDWNRGRKDIEGKISALPGLGSVERRSVTVDRHLLGSQDPYGWDWSEPPVEGDENDEARVMAVVPIYLS